MLPEHPTWFVLDASKIQEFMRCPRRFFYRYVLGWSATEASVDLVFGSAWHEAMEVLLTEGYTPEAAANAYMRFEALYRAVFRPEHDIINAPKTPANAMRALARYVTEYSNDLQTFDVLHVEVAGAVLIAPNKQIFYKTDAIVKDKATGTIYALEHKTTKSLTPRWTNQWRQKFQLGVYTHVLHCLFDPDIVTGVTVNGVQITNPPATKQDGTPRAGARDIEFRRVPVRLARPRMADWLDNAEFYHDWIMSEFDNLAEADIDDPTLRAFPKCPEACGDYYGCPFLDYCCTYPNPLKVADKPPLNHTTDFWDPRSNQEKANEVLNVEPA